MKAQVGFAKRVLILGGGLLMGTAGFTLTPSSANAGNLIGVEVGPVSVGVGIGPSEPDDVAPAPIPPATYMTPSTTYVEPAPPTEAPPAPRAPVATSTPPPPSTETTTYFGPGEPSTYPGYDPGLVPKASETTTIYYPPQ